MDDAVASVVERPPLGVGRIFTDTFAIFFRRLHWFLLLGFGPAVAIHVLDHFLSQIVETEGTDYDWMFLSALIYGGLSMVAATIGGSLGVALIVQLTQDACFGRRSRILTYFGVMLRTAVPVVLLSVALGLLKGIGVVLLVVPGIWLVGLWVAVIPVVVLERAGFGAVRRSHALTRGYRWPAAGAFIIIWLLMLVIEGALAVMLFGFGLFAADFVAESYWYWYAGANAVITTVQIGLSGICTGLIHARLREIQEGLPAESLEEVFA